MTTLAIHTFPFEGNLIAYRTFGHGPDVLLAFHGFGQTGQIYQPIEKHLRNRFTVFAIDLFFHGHSRYVSNQTLTKSDWQRLINAFLSQQRIERFSLMGFSLGGRFALSMAEGFTDRLDQLILIAPDGIMPVFWYEVATRSSLGRSLFRYVLKHLSVLNWLGHGLTRLGLLNRTVMRFVEISLNTPEQRERVYQSWTQFRRIKPDLKLISNVLTTNPIKLYFFMGAFDRIIPTTHILPLAKNIQNYELTILKTGHNRLIELTAEKLARRYPGL